MNPSSLKLTPIVGAMALLVVAGCATTNSDSDLPRPGDGVREYRRHVADFRGALADCVRDVETLAASSEKTSASAFARAQSSAHRLEIVAVKARARADALEARGAEYFNEWVEEACAATDEASRTATRARFEGLRAQFVNVQQDSRKVRESSRRFFDYVRQWRSKLGAAPPAADVEMARTEFALAAAAGRSALESVDQLLQTLATAEAAVMKAAKP